MSYDNGEALDPGTALFRQLAPEGASAPWETFADVAPVLGAEARHGLGAVMSRPGLDLRTRQLATVCMLAALGDAEVQLAFHIGGALRAGATAPEIVEALTQVSIYAGFPRAFNATVVARQVFVEHGAHATATAPRAVVIKFLDAYARSDQRACLDLLADNVVWEVPGDRDTVPWTGTWSGRGQVREHFDVLAREVTTERFVVQEPLPAGELVYVPGTLAHRFPRRGGSYQGEFVLRFRVHDGRITHYRIQEDSWALAHTYTGGPVNASRLSWGS